jgi:hypothetical protein
MDNSFDFLCDIILHVSEVSENIEQITGRLKQRGLSHDRTKFQNPEFDAFVSVRDEFKKAKYGSPEYKECVDLIKPAVDHHYQNNRHHAEYHKNGIKDMTLIDIIELIADWKAANRRNPNANFADTLPKSYEKTGMDEQLRKIITNTMKDLGWI